MTIWVFCDNLGTLEDSAPNVSILVLEYDFCLYFEKYFLLKNAFEIYQIFVNRENDAYKEKKSDTIWAFVTIRGVTIWILYSNVGGPCFETLS